MPAVKQILQRLESRKQLSGRRTFQNLYGIGYSQRRRDGYEQMDMIRLGHLRSIQIALMARRNGSAIPPVKDLLAILRAPYYTVCRPVHTIAIVYDFYHVSNFITW